MADYIKITCQCGKTLRAPIDRAGRKGKCPSCGARFVIQTQTDDFSQAPLAAEESDPKQPEPDSEYDSEPNFGLREDLFEQKTNKANPARTIYSAIVGLLVFGFGIGTFFWFGGFDLWTEKEYVIKITGTPGLKFSGCYGNLEGDQSVDGTVPMKYTVRGEIVSAVFQKKERDGTLTVELIRDGKVIVSRSTTAEFGIVSFGSYK